MDYRKECESRLLEASVGAHKLTQMISSWSTKEPNLGNEQSKDVTRDLLNGSFDLEESVITLRKLQQATWMMSRARQNLELDLERQRGLEQEEAVGFGLAHSRRLESNCIEELRKVIRESSYRRNIGSLPTSSGHHTAKGPSLIAKLMGLEAIPSDIGRHSAREEKEDKFSVQLEPPLGIEMLKARMRPLMEKKPEARRNELKDAVETAMSIGLLEENGVDDRTNSSPSNGSSHTYGEVPPIVILQTPESLNHEKFRSKKVVHEKVCDNELEKKEVAEPRDSKQIACARPQQQQRRMSNVAQRSLLREKKAAAAKMEKAAPSPTSQVRGGEQVVLAEGANAPTSHRKPDSWGSTEPAKAKKKKEVKPARKAVDIILAATGNAMYNDAKTINRSRTLPVAALPKHMENSKQCNRGHRRKDSKLFCEAMVKTSKGGSRKSRSSSSSEAKQLPDDKTTILQSPASAEDIKLLLRSSQSFIARAQELCRLDDCRTTHHHRTSAVEVRPENAELILGCARELVVRKSLQLECSNRTRLSRSSAVVVVCVGQLVEEIADEVEKLRAGRGKVAGRGASSDRDDVDVMIEGDVGCRNVLLNAMWDQGWMDWICLEEVGRVVGPLERLILFGLVEELVLDLMH